MSAVSGSRWRRLLRVVLAAAVASSMVAGRASAQPTREELTIFVNEVTTWSPGYAMGDIVLGAPDTAGYEPTNGRRQLMLRGKREGRTTLNIWDQRKALRHEIALVVTTREAQAVEADLRRLLVAYPNVALAKLGGQTLLTGTVASEQELAAVANIAQIASVRSTVSVARPAASTRATAPSTTAGGATLPTGPSAEAEADTPMVEYELELFEASSQFKTGEYGRGVEPSGRSLYKGKVAARVGEEGEIFIGGPAIDPKKKGDKSLMDTGIRLTVRPRRQAQRGGLTTSVEVETNVPLDYALYDPDVWRRSRYAFMTSDGVPFAVSGNDLLAAPAIAGGMSAMGKVQRGASTAGSMPGASGSGLQFVPVFGSLFGSSNYKTRKTQILVVFRPTVTGGP